MLPFSPTRLSCTEVAEFPPAVTTSGGGGTGVGDGVGTGVAVGAGVEVTVGAGVGVTLGATVDPHAARPRAAIAVPVMVVRFMSASTHSNGNTSQQLHPRKCVKHAPRVRDP